MKYKGKEYEVIHEYKDFILVEYIKEGYRECLSKYDLGLLKEPVIKKTTPTLKGITGNKV